MSRADAPKRASPHIPDNKQMENLAFYFKKHLDALSHRDRLRFMDGLDKNATAMCCDEYLAQFPEAKLPFERCYVDHYRGSNPIYTPYQALCNAGLMS